MVPNTNGWRRIAVVAAASVVAWQMLKRYRGGRRRDDTRRALGGRNGVFLRERVEIKTPVDVLYRFWHNPSNLARVMPYIERVDPIDAARSHWVMTGPAGKQLEWDAEVINEVPYETIGWRSLPGADVASAGSVHFRPVRDGATEVTVTMQYDPPAGRLGASLAALLGSSPSDRLREALEEFRDAMERDASYAGARRE